MDATDFTDYLQGLLDGDSDPPDYTRASTRTFARDGVLTNNDGLVVRWDDGSEFQVTVVRSR